MSGYQQPPQPPQQYPPYQQYPQPIHYHTDKSRIVAALLAFFLGGLGVHKFYLGQIGMGVVYLLFCWTMIPGIVAFVEFILLLVMDDQKFAMKYGKPVSVG